MNKKLEALERIKEFYPQWHLYNRNDFNIIEKALKREDSIEITAIDIEQDNQALCKENKKLKQVLEIIKTKRVNVGWLLEVGNVETYNFAFSKTDRHLTQEQYDLLKETLEQWK